MTMPARPRPVVIDTDPGIDDALALMLALRSPEFRIELITTVAGNVPVEAATANARRILGLIAPPAWPVLAQGAARPLKRQLHTDTAVHGADGLGGLTRLRRPDGQPRYPLPAQPVARHHAVPRLVRLARTYGNDLTVIALGPLTNIARAIQQAPEAMRNLGRLIVMGGAVAVPGNTNAVAEFNMYVDPHAADLVFSAGVPITLIPLDITRQVRLTAAFLHATVRGPGNALARAVRQMTRRWLQGPNAPGMPMHDPLTVAVGLDATLVRLESLPVRVETRGEQTLGMTVADRRRAARRPAVTAPIDVALEVDAERVLALFAERVLSSRSSRQNAVARQRPRVVVVGSANTDLTVHTTRLPGPGETVLGTTLVTAYGGKGANQALAAHRAGASVAFLGKLGRDRYGRNYADYLQRQGIDVSGLQWTAELPSGVALITVDRRGQNQITVAPGANAALMPDDLQPLPEHLRPAQLFLTQLETPFSTVQAALRQARAAGLTTLLNPAPARPVPPRLAPSVDLLVPNQHEAAVLCGRPLNTLHQIRSAAHLLRQQGYGTVIITLGQRGVVYTAAEATVHLPAHAVQARDATAAGDTFVGYLASALAAGREVSTAIALANAAAALAVTRDGAQPSIPSDAEVRAFLATRERLQQSRVEP